VSIVRIVQYSIVMAF